MIEKGFWLSFDLGIGGDYPSLYKWLDNHNALECGNGVAFVKYSVESGNPDMFPKILLDELNETVHFRPGDRLYLIYREANGSDSRVKGIFLIGGRKSCPWEGYGDINKSETDNA